MRVSRNRFEVVDVPVEAIDWSDNGNDSRLFLNGERNSLGIRVKQVENDLLERNSEFMNVDVRIVFKNLLIKVNMTQ